MEVYRAHLAAARLSENLLTAHAHAGTEADSSWERHDLMEALTVFDALAAQMPSVKARLVALDSPVEEAA